MTESLSFSIVTHPALTDYYEGIQHFEPGTLNLELTPQSSVPGPQTSSLVVAVFDVDRTLVPVTTTERIFIRYLLRKRVLGLGAVARTLLFMAKSLRKTSPFEAIRRE